MSKKKKKDKGSVLGENRRARHEYTIVETFEAGIELVGSEVKSIRAKNFHFKDAFAEFRNGELFLCGMHIAEYVQANQFNHVTDRRRKLLCQRRELNSLQGRVLRNGMTMVPINFHVSGRWIKVEIGLVKGKKEHDKRHAIKERMQKREMDRALKNH